MMMKKKKKKMMMMEEEGADGGNVLRKKPDGVLGTRRCARSGCTVINDRSDGVRP